MFVVLLLLFILLLVVLVRVIRFIFILVFVLDTQTANGRCGFIPIRIRISGNSGTQVKTPPGRRMVSVRWNPCLAFNLVLLRRRR